MNSTRFSFALRRKVLILSAIMLLPTIDSHPAHAQGDAVFEALDINEDDRLSGTELQNGRWLKYDVDRNKEVTSAEFVAGYAREKSGKTAPRPQTVAKGKMVRAPKPATYKLALVRRQANRVVGRAMKSNGQPLMWSANSHFWCDKRGRKSQFRNQNRR